MLQFQGSMPYLFPCIMRTPCPRFLEVRPSLGTKLSLELSCLDRGPRLRRFAPWLEPLRSLWDEEIRWLTHHIWDILRWLRGVAVPLKFTWSNAARSWVIVFSAAAKPLGTTSQGMSLGCQPFHGSSIKRPLVGVKGPPDFCSWKSSDSDYWAIHTAAILHCGSSPFLRRSCEQMVKSWPVWLGRAKMSQANHHAARYQVINWYQLISSGKVLQCLSPKRVECAFLFEHGSSQVLQKQSGDGDQKLQAWLISMH